MNPGKKSSLLISILIFIAVFLTDIHTPLGWTVWVFYVVPLFIVAQPSMPGLYIYAATVVNMILTYVAIFLAPPGITVANALFNRTSYIIITWIVAYFQLQRRNAYIEISQSRERFRQMADSLPQMVWSTDPDGNTDYINQRFKEYTGLPEEECFGRKWASIVHPADRQTAAEAWGRCLQQGSVFESTYRLRRWDGEYRWHLNIGLAYKDYKGRVTRWFGSSTDIHERKMAEERIKSNEEKLVRILGDLKRSNRDLEQFAYIASHDLQEPVRMVYSFTQLLVRDYKEVLDEKAGKYIEFILEGAVRMRMLINDLLEYARLTEAGRPFTAIDCEEALENAIKNLRLSVEESSAVITHDTLPVITGDEVQIMQLFQNLISNAIKFRSETTPEIHICAENRKDDWLFSVKGNGIGMDPAYSRKIFIIFQRLHEREKFSGNGIGLSICKRIVERHNGRIWVESKPYEGSTFYFTIPKKTSEPEPY
ncbi:MAG: PAS domain S-box protein [Ignavibacteria bacterium]|jgi:PAS domain S-box-containing protein|nr:PAS domain S-box protein [Ignavibacteria bacterium]MCU7504744.1 PAS domain S-box protein [Ignavibacteria bacterium]MCU7516346.1 PAS domain S-box protein [Ignavibacteria bacterium]